MTGTSGALIRSQAHLLRKDLLQLLDHSQEVALTLLLAPAGSGKSTLLRDWQQGRPGLRTAMLSLNAGDADPVRFFRRLGATLRQAAPQFDTAFYNHLSAQIELPAFTVAEALEQALEQALAQGPGLTLIIDDFQYATAPLVQAVFSQLLSRLPAQVHMILASRQHPDFSLGRLKLDNALLQIDSHDLRLDAGHVAHLAAAMQLNHLDESALGQLLQLTQGWMAGLKMALLAQAPGKDHPLHSFSGRQPELMDYFAHEVLRDLPEGLHDFMLASAILEHFDVSLCDTVLGRQDSAWQIEAIQARGLFLLENPEAPGWYRYHPLLQDCLVQTLKKQNQDRVCGLHKATAKTLLQRREIDMALDHAQQCSKLFFLPILGDCCALWLRQGDFAAIIRWVEPLPEAQVVESSELIFPLIGALIFSRRFNQARYYLDAFKHSGISHEPGSNEDSMPRFLEVLLRLFQNDSDFQLRPDQARALASCRHNDIRAFGLAVIAYDHLLHAQFNEAMRHAQQAKEVLGQLGYEYLESYADLILILCDRHCGHLIPATQRSEAFALRFGQQRQNPAWINASIAHAVVRYEQNRLEETRQLCEELIPMVSSACATEVIAYTYLTLARLLDIGGEYRRANRLLQQLHGILKLGNYRRLSGHLALEEVLLGLRHAQAELLLRTANQHQLEERLSEQQWQAGQAYDEGRERYGLATALYLRSKGDLNQALSLLELLAEAARRGGVGAREVVIMANIAVVKQLQGHGTAALEIVQRLISGHGLAGINRVVFDEAPGLGPLLAKAIQQQQLLLPDFYVQLFQNVLHPQALPPLHPSAPVPLSLTEKELEILALLREGLSNQDISQRTGIALSTTKWHMKNIFAKLGVSNRTAAILRLN